jgi:1,4-alpha-glucan branching enzyme
MTAAVRPGYRIGVGAAGAWKEIFNSDDSRYWGSGVVNTGALHTEPVAHGGKENSLVLTLPPLAATVIKLEDQG